MPRSKPFVLHRLEELKNIVQKHPADLRLIKEISLLDTWPSVFPVGGSNLIICDTVDYWKTGCKEFPIEITKIPNLTTLNFGKCNLTYLPPEIGRLTKLEVLNLHENELTELPKEIGLLKNLKILDVSHNNLKLPIEIDNLENLSEITVGRNHMTDVGYVMSEITIQCRGRKNIVEYINKCYL